MKGDPECPEARASPGRLSPSSRDRPALHPGPKGGAEVAPNVPDKRGFWKGGPAPPCIFMSAAAGCGAAVHALVAGAAADGERAAFGAGRGVGVDDERQLLRRGGVAVGGRGRLLRLAGRQGGLQRRRRLATEDADGVLVLLIQEAAGQPAEHIV